MPCGAMPASSRPQALFVFACRGRRPDGPNLGLHKFSYYPQGGVPTPRRVGNGLPRPVCGLVSQ